MQTTLTQPLSQLLPTTSVLNDSISWKTIDRAMLLDRNQ